MHIEINALAAFHDDQSQPLFKGLDYSFRVNTFTAIVGPSGSGKSTLLNVIGGLHKSFVGLIRLVEDETAHESASLPARHDFSWILQTNTVLAGRTALDNASLGLLAEGISRRESRQRASTALEALGLGQRAKASVGELSGGEIQRVTIARCLLQSAPVILADEPTGQLDATNTKLVTEALRKAATSGKIVIVATHDPEVAGGADHVLNLGQIGLG